jgi:hypothetical protein
MWLKSGVANWQQKFRQAHGFRGIAHVSAHFSQVVLPGNGAIRHNVAPLIDAFLRLVSKHRVF